MTLYRVLGDPLPSDLMQLNDVNPLEETRGSAGCVVTPTRMRGACASLPVVICIHAFECNLDIIARGNGEVLSQGEAEAI